MPPGRHLPFAEHIHLLWRMIVFYASRDCLLVNWYKHWSMLPVTWLHTSLIGYTKYHTIHPIKESWVVYKALRPYSVQPLVPRWVTSAPWAQQAPGTRCHNTMPWGWKRCLVLPDGAGCLHVVIRSLLQQLGQDLLHPSHCAKSFLGVSIALSEKGQLGLYSSLRVSTHSDFQVF